MENERVAVAEHYNARPQETRDSRRNSPIFQMRQFNNWLKHVLIDLHTRPGNTALDLCCGKGGDLHKWIQVGCTTYVGCDIAEVSVGVAAERFNKLKQVPFRPLLRVGDCFAIPIAQFIPEQIHFDIVSCQFSMHYAFQSEERVRQLLQNVTARLKPGGFFVGTTIDSNVLIRKLRAIDDIKIGTSVYKVQFDDAHVSKHFEKGNPYGIRYSFTLDQSVEDCPEYLVHFPSFVELAAEYDLEMVMHANFHDFFKEFTSDQYENYRRLIYTMNVVDEQGTISPDQWDAIYLYTAFAFKRQGKCSPPDQSANQVVRKRWPPIEKTEIVNMNS